MLVIRQKFISREDIKNNPDILYVFGDNLVREGIGGQAKEMRGETNSFGVATKRSPTYNPEDFLYDTDDDIIDILDNEFNSLGVELKKTVDITCNSGPAGVVSVNKWKAVVVPLDGIGTGIANLHNNAPAALKYIENRICELSRL